MNTLENLTHQLANERVSALQLYWTVAENPAAAVELPALRAAMAVLGRSTADLQRDAHLVATYREHRRLANPAPVNEAMRVALEQQATAAAECDRVAALLAAATAAHRATTEEVHRAHVAVEDARTAARTADELELELAQRGAPAFLNAPAAQRQREFEADQQRLRDQQRFLQLEAEAQDRQAAVMMDHAEQLAAPGSFVRTLNAQPSAGDASVADSASIEQDGAADAN